MKNNNHINYRIEPKIKPLVKIMNRVPFIKTFSSCEGHFSLEDIIQHKDKAYVQFILDESKNEKYEKFKEFILKSIVDYCWDFNVAFYQRTNITPRSRINIDYSIEIKPFEYMTTRRRVEKEMRKSTNRGIKRVTKAIDDYLSLK